MVSSFYLNRKAIHINNQKGVVLVVSLVFLIALTAVAAALMQNTTTDMKMSGASEEKVFAEQCAVSAVDNYVFEQVNGVDNSFADSVATYRDGEKNILTALTSTKDKCDIEAATLDLSNNQFDIPIDCPRMKSRSSSSIGILKCNMLRIQTGIKYGRNKTSTVEVSAGIVKEVL